MLPVFEQLQARLLLYSAFLDEGVLRIEGTDGPDSVGLFLQIDGKLLITGRELPYPVFDFLEVESVFARLYGGDDSFSIALESGAELSWPNLPSTVYGGDGNDTLSATGGNSEIYGEAGSDFLASSLFNDQLLSGGDGNDTLFSRGGNDTLDGGDGSDTASWQGFGLPQYSAFPNQGVHVTLDDLANDGPVGASGFVMPNIETLIGSAFDDVLIGRDDRGDSIRGGKGNDTIYGRGGNDTLDGTNGDDVIYGGDGDDVITNTGSPSGDRVFGGSGNDSITAGTNGDTIFGEAGFDTLTGGNGHDLINGGTGADVIFGQGGNDTLGGGKGHDLIDGGEANDQLTGGMGRDTLFGRAGNDTIRAADGFADVVRGGLDQDDATVDGGLDDVLGVENVMDVWRISASVLSSHR